jgi:hypothetical protein
MLSKNSIALPHGVAGELIEGDGGDGDVLEADEGEKRSSDETGGGEV